MEDSQKNNNLWDITTKRFVAFLDIVGFKDKIMRESHDKIYNDLDKIHTDINVLNGILDRVTVKEEFYNCEIHIVKFSDSIVLFSKSDTIANFILFLISTRFLFTSFLKMNFLIKGSISYGNISLNKEKQLYFGQPIIDAYLLEEDVNYIGIVAHHSIEEFKQHIDENNKFYTLLNQLFFEGKSPLKSGLITHLNLNWFRQLMDDENISKRDEDIRKQIVTSLRKYYLNVSGSPRRYIDNTIEFLNKNEINLNKISMHL